MFGFVILCGVLGVSIASSQTFRNTDGYINITSNSSLVVVNWNATRIADPFNDGLMSATAFTALQGKALAGNCGTGEFVQNASTSGAQCANTTGYTGSCTILGLTSISVQNGLITGCS